MPASRPILALATVLALAACDSALVSPSPATTPSQPASVAPSARQTPSTVVPSATPGASVDATAVYAAIEADVVRLRGLEPKQPVDPQLLSEAELKQRMEKGFEEDNPADLVAANELVLRALGMLEADASLGDLYVELLGSQVAGFYDPDADELYVVARSGALGVGERVTFAHEFTHALQDQHFDLDGFGLDDPTQGDRATGALALIEGDATAVMSYWAQEALTPEELVQVVREALTPEAVAVLERMPPILRESLEFPYSAGLQLVLGLQLRGGWRAVDEAFGRPPVSTEQVIHPEKYAAREEPVAVKLPADLATRMGTGWKLALEDTFGEFRTQVWLRNALRRVEVGNVAAAGWGGDRMAALQGPRGAWALVWKTAWDTSSDGTEFIAAARDALAAEAAGESRHFGSGTEYWIVIGSDAATLRIAAAAAGLPEG